MSITTMTMMMATTITIDDPPRHGEGDHAKHGGGGVPPAPAVPLVASPLHHSAGAERSPSPCRGGSNWLQPLLAWTSPSYPVGAFSYSHGLEAAVDAGDVRNRDTLAAYIEAVIARGGGWVDAVLFAQCHRTAADSQAFDELSELAAAFRGSAETALEARQMGRSFLSVTRAAWPHPWLDAFAERNADRPVAHAAAGALACAAHGVPVEPGLTAWVHATAANLVSAGVRLIPLGQTDGQIATARLGPVIAEVAARALAADPDDLGTAAPLVELASLAHETQYTRLFRS